MSVLCYGEIDLDIYLALDRLPSLNQAADVTDEFENVGGAAANSAIWLANWAVPTRLAGHDQGQDAAGELVRRVLASYPQLDTRFITWHAGYRTPRCQCLVTPDGERSFIMHWLDELRMTAPSLEMLEGIKWLNLDMSGPLEPRLQAAQMAAENGISVLINDIYRTDHPLLPWLDLLVISASIARSRFPNKAPIDLACELQNAADCAVIMTDSSASISILPQQGERSSITPPPIHAIDTTGAGDIFKSGLLYGLTQGLPLEEAARWGVAAGSLMCQFAGTTKTVAPLSAVRDLLAKIA